MRKQLCHVACRIGERNLQVQLHITQSPELLLTARLRAQERKSCYRTIPRKGLFAFLTAGKSTAMLPIICVLRDRHDVLRNAGFDTRTADFFPSNSIPGVF
jgi:hypothetical protein